MMGERRSGQEALFYEFSLERHVPVEHLLRSIDRFVELDGVRCELAPFYSEVGRPSIDPELMIRMLIVGYCFGIRSERRLCDEVHLNLGYRWFCRLGLDGAVPDHSGFSKNRHGRFRDGHLFRRVFAIVFNTALPNAWSGGDGFALDASSIHADAGDRHRVGVMPACRSMQLAARSTIPRCPRRCGGRRGDHSGFDLMVLPERIELSTSPLPREGISRKTAQTLALASRSSRNIPRIDGTCAQI